MPSGASSGVGSWGQGGGDGSFINGRGSGSAAGNKHVVVELRFSLSHAVCISKV